MGMTKKLWSINALATEFGMDRRTVAKRIEDIPFDGRDRGSPQWYIASVMWALAPDPPRGKSTYKGDIMADVIGDRLKGWRDICTPDAAEAGRMTLDEFAPNAGLTQEAALACIRAGMPYRVPGDFITGEGFVVQFHQAAEWTIFVKAWLTRAGRTGLLRALGI
jgi:hypothetical protein